MKLSAPQIGVRNTRRLVGQNSVLREHWPTAGIAAREDLCLTSALNVKTHKESVMNFPRFILAAICAASFTVQPAGAAEQTDDSVIEVVTFKLKPGITPEEFAPIAKRVETQHVARQPGFISRESAAGPNGEMLAIVHGRSIKDAEASMASFEKAPAAADFMAKIDASTMTMRRYQK
jgi:hypothetical protein